MTCFSIPAVLAPRQSGRSPRFQALQRSWNPAESQFRAGFREKKSNMMAQDKLWVKKTQLTIDTEQWSLAVPQWGWRVSLRDKTLGTDPRIKIHTGFIQSPWCTTSKIKESALWPHKLTRFITLIPQQEHALKLRPIITFTPCDALV